MKTFTREMSIEVLRASKTRCLRIPDGYEELSDDFALMFDEHDSRLHFSSIYIPASVKKINGIFLTEYDIYVTDIRFFKEFIVDEENECFRSVDGVLFSKDGKKLISFPCGKYIKKYMIPDGVEEIADSAFINCIFTQEIVMPDSVRRLGEQAFASCDGLKEINIPDGVEYIGDECFLLSSGIHRLCIPAGVETVFSSNISYVGVMFFGDSLKRIDITSLSAEITGEYCQPLLLSHDNIAVEEFAETYGFNYFSDYVIDEKGVIWSPDRKTLIDFPSHWESAEYIVPENVTEIFRWAFNNSDVKRVVTRHPVTVVGETYDNDFSRIVKSDAIGYDENFFVTESGEDKNGSSGKTPGYIRSEGAVPYAGDKEYVFISYSHKDSDRVLPIIERMIGSGCRVWFDEGIDPGTEWARNIANHVNDAGLFISFISRNYLDSPNCVDELQFAHSLNKERFIVFLEETELPLEMQMQHSRVQNIHKYKYRSEEAFYERLLGTKLLDRIKETE